MLDGMHEIKTQEFQQRANLVRLQTCTLINMSGRSLKDGEKLTPAELWPFSWDDKTSSATGAEGMTDEQILEHNARLAAMLE